MGKQVYPDGTLGFIRTAFRHKLEYAQVARQYLPEPLYAEAPDYENDAGKTGNGLARDRPISCP